MKLIEVADKKTQRAFLQLPDRLYKGNPNWIKPLDQDIEAVFDPTKNKFFRNGECIRWLLADDNGAYVGRVAAFYHNASAKKDNDQPTGGMGFFECINDQKAAFMLFDACKEWLQSKGMEAMDGPINFGERDKWWGLLVEGYDKDPNYCCNYHPPYYRDLFEAYGFQVYFKQFTYGRRILGGVAAKLDRKAEMIRQDPRYRVGHLQMKDIDRYTEDFRTVYNRAWANHSGVPEMTSLHAKTLIKSMKPIMDPDLLWFAYYDDKPIAFFIMLPEVNEIFRHVNGKLDWWGKLVFVYRRWRKLNKKILGVIFGIDPDHQGKGVDGAMIVAMRDRFYYDPTTQYEMMEMNWIGDFNPKMIVLVEQQVGADKVKVHHTYRVLFDPSKPFKRMPVRDLGLR